MRGINAKKADVCCSFLRQLDTIQSAILEA